MRSLAFFQNFGLDLSLLGRMLRCVADNPVASYAQLGRCAGVNDPKAEGFLGWLRHTGLVMSEAKTRSSAIHQPQTTPTPFGQLALRYDPALADPGTLWVLHYYLATEHTERSEAWLQLINYFISPGLSFTIEQFQHYFTDAIGSLVANRSALKKDPQTTLSAYVRPEVLGRLGILIRNNKQYIVSNPHLPDTLVVGYVLFDWWQRRHLQTDTLRFSLLCQEEGSIGRTFLADATRVRQIIYDLAGQGYLTFSETQHEPVNRLFKGPADLLLERYYQR